MSGATGRQDDAVFTIEPGIEKALETIAERGHDYWTHGEGLAKWAASPHPFAALRRHLAEFIHDPDELDRTTAQWHHDALGFWPGRGREKSFDPAEMRDGHGRWVLFGDAVHAETVKVGDQEVHVTAHSNGDRTLTFPSGDKARLSHAELAGKRRSLRTHVAVAAEDESRSLHTIDRIVAHKNAEGRLVADSDDVIGVRRAPGGHGDAGEGGTMLSLHVGKHLTDDSPEVLRLTEDQATGLILDAQDIDAYRMGSGVHRLDVLRDGTDVVMRPEGGGEWRLNRRSARRLEDEISDLFDDEINGRGERTATLHTNEGQVTVTAHAGELGGLTIASPGRSSIVVPPGLSAFSDFVQALRASARID